MRHWPSHTVLCCDTLAVVVLCFVILFPGSKLDLHMIGLHALEYTCAWCAVMLGLALSVERRLVFLAAEAYIMHTVRRLPAGCSM